LVAFGEAEHDPAWCMVMQEKMALILNNGIWEVVDLQVVH
jgi:hypothetical protein